MAENIEKEIEAIKTVLTALEPLSPEARSHVLGYVLTRLKIALPAVQQVERSSIPARPADLPSGAAGGGGPQPTVIHIKSLKEQKKPHSASEMAALVAYYMANVAPEKDRRDRINTKLVETYFKIAEFPLSQKPQFTLPNAKAAGYLDAVGNGEYKLNAVGHNLIVHGMPREKDGRTAPRRARASKRVRRPAKR
jgi:hypothetical protein